MLKQLKILLWLIAGLAVTILAFFFIYKLAIYAMYTQGITSLILFVIIVFIQFSIRKKTAAALTVATFIASVMGMILDTWGNELFNKPLVWLYASKGQLLFNNHVDNYAPGEYSISTTLTLLGANGEMQDVSAFILYGYRFFQYLILYLIIGYLIRLLTKNIGKEQPVSKAKESFIPSEVLTASEKQEVLALLKNEQKVTAIKFVVDHTNPRLSLTTAKRYVEWLDDEYL